MAARSFAGKFVLVQPLELDRCGDAEEGDARRQFLGAFRVRLHQGRSRLRVVMPTS